MIIYNSKSDNECDVILISGLASCQPNSSPVTNKILVSHFFEILKFYAIAATYGDIRYPRYFELVKPIALIDKASEKSPNNGLNNSLTLSLSHNGGTQHKSQHYFKTGHEHQISPRALRHCLQNHRMGWRRHAITRETYKPVL